MVTFFVHGDPQPGGSKKGFAYIDKKTGKTRVNIVDDAKRNKEWRSLVAHMARKVMGEDPPLKGALSLDIVFLVRRPKSHYGTGRNAGYLKKSAPRYPTTRPDQTKLLRSTEDALTGIVWRDDAQVVRQFIQKNYTPASPGARIDVLELEPEDVH